MKLSDVIQTEFGDTEVFIVKAHKEHKCPLCDGEKIEVGEIHCSLIPINYDTRRRHVHRDCFEAYIENNWSIKIHPNAIS